MRFLYRPQLSDANIRALLSYKGAGEDRSWTYRYVLSPYVYDNLIHHVPVSIAPNLITFIGFLCTLLSHLLVVSYPDSRICVLCSALGQLVYMVLDNLDGRQARRTRSSSPLGHLFDHGCDALNVTLATLTMTTALHLSVHQAFMFVVLAQMGLVACGVEEYVTGRMVLREINGPNEGQLLLIGNLFITAALGADAWHGTIYTLSISGVDVDVTTVHAGIAATIVATFGVVVPVAYACYHTKNQHSISILRITESFLAYLLFFAGWLLISPDSLRKRWVCAAWTSAMFVFDYVSKLIIAHLTADTAHLPRTVAAHALFCMCLLPFISIFKFSNMLSIVITGVAIGAVLWRATCIVHQLCHVLNIHCFKLRSSDNLNAGSKPNVAENHSACNGTEKIQAPGVENTDGPNVHVEGVENGVDLDTGRGRLRRRS